MSLFGFELVREQAIPELKSHAKVFRHLQSGAELVSIENDDENKSFGVTFRTVADDSTGIAHILEHCVLGGSEKYRAKEPFLELVKGSMQTMVNASTYPDKTTYYVASTNRQDFYNLVDVYLDAVFHPLITPQHLAQEGWHFELENLEDPLNYRGIVFNEMKGAYSSPDEVLYQHSLAALFPDTFYRYDSGGLPTAIPDLTYEQFTQFYKTHYHPSNARIWFYGDDALESRLEILDTYLRDFHVPENAQPIEIPLQPSFDAPRHETHPYAVSDDGEALSFVILNWLLPETIDPRQTLAFRTLNHILIGTPASPLHKALIESGLGEDLAGNDLEVNLRQMTYSTGLRGVAAENVDAIEPFILDTLKGLVENGIDPDTILASMNTIEFRLRENNTGGYPRGLGWMLSALTSWLYGGDPLAVLSYEANLTYLREQLAANPRYFEGLIQTWLLDNPHRTTLVLAPDTELAAQMEAAERQRLDEAKARMSHAELTKIVEETAALMEWQNTPDSPEALAAIPRLNLSDLDKNIKTIPIMSSDMDGTEILHHDLFTNGIVYLDLAFDLHTLSAAQLPYVTLLGRAFLEMGTHTEDFVKLAQRIGQNTGGIGVSDFISQIHRQKEETAWLIVRGKATMPKAETLLGILRDMLLDVHLDNQERFAQIVLQEKADVEAGLVPSGHMAVYTRLQSHYSVAGWVDEQIGGVDYLFFLRELVNRVQTDWQSVAAELTAVRQALVNRHAMVVNVTLDATNYATFAPQLEAFLQELPCTELTKHEWTITARPTREGLTIPAQINFVGKGAPLYDLGYTLDGSIFAISKYLSLTYLWEKIRVMGGAYGGFNIFEPNSGLFCYISYRDPNLLVSLDNYDGATDYLLNIELTEDQLRSAIIGAISNTDQYQLPDAKGFTSMQRYLTRVTDEMRQRYRHDIFETQAEDFRRLGEFLKEVVTKGDVAVLGSQDGLEKANVEKGANWFTLTKVL